ncbi:hypothetical protein HWV01_16125 [Moritella sp. 5]|uniref:hypothetical protein n=1 Tax=Moritella sp. 5 TaxID=2746231 RepID=UPI001BABA9D3|nr:hypothetical protein [Moritella sp. 5]QUM81701.1 hypothetical protein HWV01_16125 [Moritella sp. 5]
MKVIVEFIVTGQYKDRVWEPSFHGEKGSVRALSPSYAARLINESKAKLYINEEGKPEVEQ